MPTPLVTLDSICKSFGSLQILKEITLSIHQGEITSIVGPSGAGKTTLLQIIGTLLKPDKGELSIGGVNPFALSAQKQAHFRNKQIGFVFQFHQLLPEFTAAENVAIPAMIAGMSKRQALSEAEQLLTQLGLADRLKHRPAQLSGGEKQRTAVARALINRPTLILADEPSGSLDTQRKEELIELFFELRDQLGQTFLIVTHDEDFAQRADRTLSLQDGRIIADTYAPDQHE
ncbi:MAG: ABC transporter ATP-binding protein [Porphyromonas sp.]|uniref:ABC transporter ATP-binding protein n=1 Tax=Porphyromonas sp. TaxID=1924944 RepID=UPI00262F473C|nr:ABC transporter ATP-binding protein [Porphyromonas sp.]MDD6928501.1 ABC transporter ATP-binding protein [Bacteroidales bacterium]MDY3111053.1 ABC transporter ATP-binding protein [Porphyromonas sp.]MDY4246246.1 ABC transporter ATP-binding protein [Porphyromonas sp.]